MAAGRWIAFCLEDAVSKSVLHFFPSAHGVAVPYPAECKITLFGPNIGRANVVLEGARLSQPDGVRLEDAFAQLREGVTGLLGLQVRISSAQPKLDLSISQCMLEIGFRGFGTKFRPKAYPTIDQPKLLPNSTAAIKDCFSASSLIVVNANEEPYEPSVRALVLGEREVASASGNSTATEAGSANAMKEDQESEFVRISSVEAQSVKEVNFGENFYKRGVLQESSWGMTRARTVFVDQPIPKGVAYFMVNRDIKTGRPISVCAL